jgi:RNA polymerase-associated protein
VITLYDADRCPFCARVRIVLAEKGVEYEVVEVDLDDRPAWIYDKNPLGRVPVFEEDDFVLPESAVINEYLEERWPEPALWPSDPGERAAGAPARASLRRAQPSVLRAPARRGGSAGAARRAARGAGGET